MGAETVFLLIVLYLTCFLVSARQCKLCEFEKRFEHVRPTCRSWSKADNTSISMSVAAINKEVMVYPTDGTSRGTTSGIDCFEIIGNKTFQIKSGSSTVNVNCTRRITCINGKMNVDGPHSCSSNAVCEMRNDVRKCYCITGYHGDGETCTNETTNCLDIFNAGYTTDGVYAINPSNWTGPSFEVYCNMSQGGGWTVFQRRVNGSVDFYRNWESYKEGFGQLDHEFWLGNDKLYYLTNQGNCTLRIDLVNRDGDPYYAEYDIFRINDESDNYRLSELGAYNGTAGDDALRNHLNYSFSTFDRDNDDDSINCAVNHHGAWWYWNCRLSNLNGDYGAADGHLSSIFWWNLPGSQYNIKYTEMKIRPKI